MVALRLWKGGRSVLELRKRGREFVGRCSMKVGGMRMFWQEGKWFRGRGEKVPEAKSRGW
jgi:hypothetical protein